ncbi:hypothetical protein [Bradyrhizobium sp. HKCCYLS20291]|uniref:hypothetical protein n=1 Tax=Bradyrhizobium sp. HKCCYLS20291 TaxID=3420766 RepID=UPI003EBD3BE8
MRKILFGLCAGLGVLYAAYLDIVKPACALGFESTVCQYVADLSDDAEVRQ